MKKTPKESSPARDPVPQLAGDRVGSHTSVKEYVLHLYVSGSTLKSARAVENIKRVCEEHLKNRYDLEVIDVYQQSNLARDERIVAVPTLIIRNPGPMRRLSGDLSNPEKLLLALDLKEPD
jgi:circadian clock protein KaiB